MKMTRLLVLLLILLLPCAALSEALMGEDSVQLYAEGAFPPAPQERPALFAAVTIEDTLLEGLQSQSAEISVSRFSLTVEAFKAVYQDVLNSHPELFYVGGSYRYSYSSSGIVQTVLPTYKYTGADLQARIAAYNASLAEILRDANRAGTTLGKLLRLNEYFCLNFQYDTSHSIFSPDELFSTGQGVCQAYMLGIRAALNALGIENATVTSDKMNHTWNLVMLGGSWYHLDVTWDDPLPDVPLGAYHDNFLRSDTGITDARHYAWNAPAQATDTRYDDFFWSDLGVPLSVLGDTVYYVDTQMTGGKYTIRAWREGDSGGEAVFAFSPANANGGYISRNTGEPTCANEARVYYAVWDEIYSVDHSGGDVRLEYAIGDSTMRIWSMVIDGTTMRLYASNSNGSKEALLTVELTLPLTFGLTPDAVQLTPGSTAQLAAQIVPVPAFEPELTFASSCEAVAAVDENGLITAGVPGRAVITAQYIGDISASCEVLVRCGEALVLPESLLVIGDGAFEATDAQEIVLPGSVSSIGAGAFAGSGGLLYVNLPDTLTDIAPDAFAGCSRLTLLCAPGSAGEAYAGEQGIPCVTIDSAAQTDAAVR